MKENKTYKEVIEKYLLAKKNNDKEELKLLQNLLNEIRNSYNLNEFAIHEFVKVQQHMYTKNIDSFTAQKIGSAVWKAVEAVLFKKGKKAHYKKYNTLSSIEGKTNGTGIRFIDNKLLWNKLSVPVIIRENDLFAHECLENRKIKFCRLIRKPFNTGFKYFLQLIMEGLPPVKRNNKTGEFKRTTSPNKKVGIDIGTSTIAVCSNKKVILTELAKNSKVYDREIINLKRKLQRSKIATNPLNYNEDGTIKRGVKLVWVCSKNYIKTLFRLKNMYRKKANYIKQEHNKLANEVLNLGNEVYVETMNFKALQKRAKETTKNKNGKFNRKKRFGKSLNNKAPAMLLEIIAQKLGYIEKDLNKVNTKTFKASQYNHIENRFIKKKLSKRWNKLNDDLIQRDLYSAFLLMNSNKSLNKVDRNLCNENYDRFKINHNICINEIKNSKESIPSSFGIKKVS